MFVYFGKRFDSANVGRTVVGVKCDKCGCEYYYELARIGAGSSSAPYNIGTGAAEKSAQQQAERDLQRRLASEAELVPCPNCNWINDELASGYRRGQYRGFAKPTMIITIIGTAIGLLCGLYISIGPPRDRPYAPYFLYGGPGLSAAFAAAMFLLRAWLRSRIRPNRNYPQAPALPPGTPPALLLDEASEELRPAQPDQTQDNAGNGWQDFQLGRHLFPLLCCDCLKPATTEHAFAIPVSGNISVEVPRCASCGQKTVGVGNRGWLILGAVAALAAGMALVIWKADADYSAAANCSLITLFFAAVALIVVFAPRAPGPVEAEVVDQSRGVVRLRFRNAEYGRLVAKQVKESDEIAGTKPEEGSSTAFQE